jgi:uncharacterized membrane protein
MSPVKGREGTPSWRRTIVVRLLLLGTIVSLGLIAVRVFRTGSSDAANLVWNLVLAWIPFVLAVLVYDGYRRGASRAPLLAGAALWLLFLPNAPYILTDFKYLRVWDDAPGWYDLLLLSAAAGTGLALGFVSLYLMQTLARSVLRPFESWLFVVGVLGLSSLGVYLGRFERWNSWDVFAQPWSLLSDVGQWLSDPLEHGRALVLMTLFTAFLTVAYGVFCRLMDRGLRDSRG